MSNLTRREFVRNAVLTAAATRLAVASLRGETTESKTIQSTPDGKAGVPAVRWLDGSAPAAHPGTTWGMPWPRGRHAAGTTFTSSLIWSFIWATVNVSLPWDGVKPSLPEFQAGAAGVFPA